MSDKEVAPAVNATPRGPTTRKGVLMATRRILQNAVSNETRRVILREAEDRYRNELLPDEERQLLRDRVLRLKRQLRLA